MKTYHVTVAIRILERYRVEAEDAELAAECWDEGKLIHTDDYPLDTEVVFVKEQRP